MSAPHLELPAPKDLNAARRQFVELYGSTAVMNTYLKIALLCLSGVCLALSMLVAKAYEAARNVKPLVIRISEVGRAEAVSYSAYDYHPQEAEIKYFLIQFVQEHYSPVARSAMCLRARLNLQSAKHRPRFSDKARPT